MAWRLFRIVHFYTFDRLLSVNSSGQLLFDRPHKFFWSSNFIDPPTVRTTVWSTQSLVNSYTWVRESLFNFIEKAFWRP